MTAFSSERHRAALQVLTHLFGPVMSKETVIGHWRKHKSNSHRKYDADLEARSSLVRAAAARGGETALLLINFQNDFCSDTGMLAAQGAGICNIRQCIPRTKRLLDAAGRAAIPAFHVKLETHPLAMNYGAPVCVTHKDGVRITALANTLNEPVKYLCVAGTPGGEFVSELAPLSGERVFTARRFSAFADTSLDMLVGANDIDHLIIGGVTTEGAVEATAREALDRTTKSV